MLNRKSAVSMAIVAAVTATMGSAFAEGTATKAPVLSLEPSVALLDDASTAPAADAGPSVSRPTSPSRPLMSALDKLGAASTMDKYNINIYGWVEGSYTYNHRHTNHDSSVFSSPGVPVNKVGIGGTLPFNHEAGDNVMGNQLAIRFERQIQSTEHFEVGGMVEVMYGQDAAAIHSNGLEYGNSGSDGDRLHPNYQFDIPQAYVDIAVGVKGLTFRVGKFYALCGYELIQPDANPLFSHSYLFYAMPFTQTGVVADYKLNDQWEAKAGVTRGWDQATEDGTAANNNCAVDGVYQVLYTPNSQLTAVLSGTVGPNDGVDTSHYRVMIDPTITYKVTDSLSVGAEVLYIYDGGFNAHSVGDTHHYGDVWGIDLYAGYKINDFFTVNGRAEKAHFYNGVGSFGTGVSTVNVYSFTLGVTITPFANDTTGFGSALKIRPEIRYDYSEDRIYDFGGHNPNGYKDQFTMAVDVIYAF
jgi:hypothetical protein